MAIFEKQPFWIFFSKKKKFFCFILMKISQNLYGRMDGSKFLSFPWLPGNFLLCVILRYTVYVFCSDYLPKSMHGRMDGSGFWCFPWFPQNYLLCVILRYTVSVATQKGIAFFRIKNSKKEMIFKLGSSLKH